MKKDEKINIGNQNKADTINDTDALRFSTQDGSIRIEDGKGLINIQSSNLITNLSENINNDFSSITELSHMYQHVDCDLKGLETITFNDFSSSVKLSDSILLGDKSQELLSTNNPLIINTGAFSLSQIGDEDAIKVFSNNILHKSDFFGTDVNNAITINEGAFIVSQEGLHIENGVGKSVFIKDSRIMTSPTDRLISGDNNLLGINLEQGTLSINTDTYDLIVGSSDYPGILNETKNLLLSTQWNRIGEDIGADILAISNVQDSFLVLSDSYTNLFNPNIVGSSTIGLLPSPLNTFTSDEYYDNALLLNRVSFDEPKLKTYDDYPSSDRYKTNPILLEQLRNLNSLFDPMLTGAIQALNSNNPDRVRHFSISSRELFSKALYYLSPIKKIEQWSISESDFHNGRPTRRARLNYICRNINQENFEDFVNSDCLSSKGIGQN